MALSRNTNQVKLFLAFKRHWNHIILGVLLLFGRLTSLIILMWWKFQFLAWLLASTQFSISELSQTIPNRLRWTGFHFYRLKHLPETPFSSNPKPHLLRLFCFFSLGVRVSTILRPLFCRFYWMHISKAVHRNFAATTTLEFKKCIQSSATLLVVLGVTANGEGMPAGTSTKTCLINWNLVFLLIQWSVRAPQLRSHGKWKSKQ